MIDYRSNENEFKLRQHRKRYFVEKWLCKNKKIDKNHKDVDIESIDNCTKSSNCINNVTSDSTTNSNKTYIIKRSDIFNKIVNTFSNYVF